MISTVWGIRFSLEANPNGSNENGFDTVLPRLIGLIGLERLPRYRKESEREHIFIAGQRLFIWSWLRLFPIPAGGGHSRG
jgi:hypothetical protein